MFGKSILMKMHLSDNPTARLQAKWLVVIICAIHFLSLGFAWNHTDSFVLLTVNFIYMVPQHTPLYPLILEFLRSVFDDLGAILIATVILQHVVFLFSAFQFINSVKHPVVAAMMLCLLYPIFIIQNGIYTEALFASFLLLLLSTAYRVYKNGLLRSRDQWLFMFSILGLTLTRHVGILYAVLPILVTFGLPTLSGKQRSRAIALQLLFIVVPILTSNMIKAGFGTMDVPMYGRPGMHVIEKVFTRSSGNGAALMQKWMDNAQNEDVMMAQQIISEAKDMWYIPRVKIVGHLREKYPQQDSLLLELKTEELMNSAFRNMMLTGDVAVFKQCMITSVLLALAPPKVSTSLLLQDKESKESSLFEESSVFRVNYPSYLRVPLVCVKIFFCILHALFSFTMLVTIVVGFFKRWFSNFSIFLLFLFFAQLAAHAIFTIVVARYSIHLELTLFFILLDMIDSASDKMLPRSIIDFVRRRNLVL